MKLFLKKMVCTLMLLPMLMSCTPDDEKIDVTLNMSELEQQILNEINLLRANPKAYIAKLETYKSYFTDKSFKYPEEDVVYRTNEGISAIDECIKVLSENEKLYPVSASTGLCLAAKDHATFLNETDSRGHRGKDDSTPFDRMDQHGKWVNTAAENICYGYDNAERIIIALLVDDGVPSRGHRKNLLNKIFKQVGISCGAHPTYGTVCVMDFAASYREKFSEKE